METVKNGEMMMQIINTSFEYLEQMREAGTEESKMNYLRFAPQVTEMIYRYDCMF